MQFIIHILCVGIGVGMMYDASTKHIKYSWVWGVFGVGATILAAPIYWYKRNDLITTATTAPYTTTKKHWVYFWVATALLMVFTLYGNAVHENTVQLIFSSDMSSALEPINEGTTFGANQEFYVSVYYNDRDVFNGYKVSFVLRPLGEDSSSAELLSEIKVPDEGNNVIFVPIRIYEPGGYRLSVQSGGEILCARTLEIR